MEKIKKIGSRGKYFRKTFLIFFSIFMVLVIAISGYLVLSGAKNTEERISAFENNEIEKTATEINSSLYQVATVCSYLSTINFADNLVVSPNENYQSYLISQNQIDSYSTIFNYINEIYVRDSSGKLYHTSKAEKQFPQVEGESSKLNGELRNSQIYTTTKQNAFENFYFLLSSSQTGYADNDVCVSLNTIALAKQILSYAGDRVECIVDGNGIILSSYDASKIGSNLYDAYKIHNYGVSDFTRQVKIDETDHIVTMKKIKNTELYAASITDKDYYSAYFKSNIYSSILICFIFFVAAVMICTVIIQVSYRPIKDILLQIQQYQEVNIDKDVNEINYINEKLAEMYQSNALLDEKSRKALGELKSWNVAALQAQICPHFLYNTLDSINWLAYKHLDMDNPISLAVQDTAYIMRLSLDISRMLSNISEEIEVTKKYIEILDVRYEHRFNIIWDIDESVLDCVIPRLCIQPLIENAVNHAFIDNIENNAITISVKGVGQTIVITVSDNGVGIPVARLAQIKENINTNNMGTGKNVGLRNINMRCKIIYGNEYGLTIESDENSGSAFHITIPKDRYNDYAVVK
ncbi:MAG: histidine kinase [Clostridia bacterium]|nr:histidine kinase [Clostridia bacterium]